MKNFLALSVLLIFCFQNISAQEQKQPEQKPHIEVLGYAEKKVVPDEIYLSITIKERTNGKEKISVAQQEAELKNKLKQLGIALDLLSVADAQADYIRLKFGKRESIAQTEYELKLSTAKQVSDVLETLDEMKIQNVFISRVSHSQIKELVKSVEIEAIKAAKEKAGYLLAAIGQQTGMALSVVERNVMAVDNYYMDGVKVRGSQNIALDNSASGDKSSLVQTIEFKKIQINKTVLVKFEIK